VAKLWRKVWQVPLGDLGELCGPLDRFLETALIEVMAAHHSRARINRALLGGKHILPDSLATGVRGLVRKGVHHHAWALELSCGRAGRRGR
jgi:hypothetical protein